MKRFTAALSSVAILALTTMPVQAHPGRTDSSGGHTCRTNCERWGREYGEYHYHDGSSSSSGSSSTTPRSQGSKGGSGSSEWLWVLGIVGAGYYGLRAVAWAQDEKAKTKRRQQMMEQHQALLEANRRQGLVCKACSSPLELKHGRYGRFYGCSCYPHCRYTVKYLGNRV